MKLKFLLLVVAMLLAVCKLGFADLISEFQPNPDGTDPAMTTIEISGTPGAMFNLAFLTIEAEGSAIGVIDSVNSVMGTYDVNGLATFSIGDFENPAFTAILVNGLDAMVATVGTDLDTNNDGVVDLTPWMSVLDSLNVPDGGSAGSGDIFYGSNSVSVPPMGFDDEPISVFRDASTGVWYAVNEDSLGTAYFVFDAAGTQLDPSLFDIDPTTNSSTFGAINPTIVAAVPEPGLGSLLAICFLSGLNFRRR